MFETLMGQSVFVVAILAMGIFGCVAKVMMGIYMNVTLKAAENMGETKHRQLVSAKKRYGELISMNACLKNTEAFVTPYINRIRLFGVCLSKWQAFTKNMLILSIGTGIFGGLFQYYRTETLKDSLWILCTATCVATAILLCCNIFDFITQEKRLSMAVCNYVGNSLSTRLEKKKMKLEKKEKKKTELAINIDKDEEAKDLIAAAEMGVSTGKTEKLIGSKKEDTGQEFSDELFSKFLSGIIS